MFKKIKGSIEILHRERRYQECRLNNQSDTIRFLERQLDGLIEYLDVEMVHYPEKNVFEKKEEKQK